MDEVIKDRDGYDVAVVGAGAAGLMAGIAAAERGLRTIVLEKNRRPGVKILMSGGTRCNITNARGLRSLRGVSGPIDPAYDARAAHGARSIQQAFGPEGGAFLGPALRAFSVEDTIAFFEHEGVATKIEHNGKVFPVSDRASDVLEALLKRCRRSGAELRTNCPVLEVESIEGGFAISAAGPTVLARSVIITTGGRSYPGCGTTGDGYAIAERFGHALVLPRPALVPVRVGADWVAELKGLTVPDALVSVVHDQTGNVLQKRRESVLFAHFGLTGPAVLDVSRAVAREDSAHPLSIQLDLAPDLSIEALDGRVQAECRLGRPLVSSVIAAIVPRRLGEPLLNAASIPRDRRGPELARDERRRLLGVLKGLRLPITGTLGFAKAEVTSGGVRLDEVEPATLQSRRRPGLFFAGEILDLDGPIGGYNFQAAWSTGWLAGRSA